MPTFINLLCSIGDRSKCRKPGRHQHNMPTSSPASSTTSLRRRLPRMRRRSQALSGHHSSAYPSREHRSDNDVIQQSLPAKSRPPSRRLRRPRHRPTYRLAAVSLRRRGLLRPTTSAQYSSACRQCSFERNSVSGPAADDREMLST